MGRRQRTLARIESYPKVRDFLSSISRVNAGTARTYNFALSHFQTFLENVYKHKGYDIQTVLTDLKKDRLDVYTLLDKFVGYLALRQDGNTSLSPNSVRLYVAGVESYLADNRIYISTRILKRTVRFPRKFRGIKEPLNAQDIRDIILSCKNDTLKAFLLTIGSSGIRSMEALSLRNCDVNFLSSPTMVTIRSEISKTKQSNKVYISDEATKYLKEFINSKYSKPHEYENYPNHLIFSKEVFKYSTKPINIYRMLHTHFIKLLAKIEKDKRKDGLGVQRREINFHLFRSYVYTAISNTGNTQYAEWMLSHSGSTYWRSSESERRKLYLENMKYLTFLDFPTVESVGADYLSKLQERDQEIQALRDSIKAIGEDVQELENKAIYEGSGWFKDSVVGKIDDLLKKKDKQIQETEEKP